MGHFWPFSPQIVRLIQFCPIAGMFYTNLIPYAIVNSSGNPTGPFLISQNDIMGLYDVIRMSQIGHFWPILTRYRAFELF